MPRTTRLRLWLPWPPAKPSASSGWAGEGTSRPRTTAWRSNARPAGARAPLPARNPLRVVRWGGRVDEPASDNGLEFKRVAGGVLVQKRFDSRIVRPEDVDIVSVRKPSPEEGEAAIFNWIVACFTRSNAVVIGQRDKVHGIGSGQRSRIDPAERAVRFSRRGYGPEGCVLASDAFMPFPDVVELAARSGITALIYPLGSVKDQEVIDRANELSLAMIVTRRATRLNPRRWSEAGSSTRPPIRTTRRVLRAVRVARASVVYSGA